MVRTTHTHTLTNSMLILAPPLVLPDISERAHLGSACTTRISPTAGLLRQSWQLCPDLFAVLRTDEEHEPFDAPLMIGVKALLVVQYLERKV